MTQDVELAPTAEHRTVTRVMRMLEAVVASEPDGLRLTDLSYVIDAPKSSAHALVKGLVALGYLSDEDGKYVVGSALALLHAVSGDERRKRAIQDQLRRLAEASGETAMAGMLVGDSVVFHASVESTMPLRATVQLNTRLPLWPSSSGKCLLAHMPPRRREACLDRIGLVNERRAEALDELAQVRSEGVAFNRGGTVAGQYGVASPIITPGQPVTMTIAVTGPEVRLVDKLEQVGQDVKVAAEHLAAAIW